LNYSKYKIVNVQDSHILVHTLFQEEELWENYLII